MVKYRGVFLILILVLIFTTYLLYQRFNSMDSENKLFIWDIKNDSFLRFSSSGQAHENVTVTETYKYLVETDNGIKNLERHYVTFPHGKNRLGNWMFYFAATVGMARTLKYKFAISPNHPLVNYFYIPKEHVMDIEMENMMNVSEENWRNATWRQNKDYLSFNLTLASHFLGWSYFYNVFDELTKMFTIRPKYLNQALAFLNENIPMNKTLIGIHVRRTDSISRSAIYHGKVAANMTFFTTSMAYFRGRYRDIFFVVVSDDQKWCRENIVGDNVVYSEFKEPIIDMAIMSVCDHAITTVGTFSWWSGWLSKGNVVYLHDFPKPGSRLDKRSIIRKEYYLPYWIGIRNNGSIYEH